MNIKPVKGYLLVEPIVKEKTASGLYLPNQEAHPEYAKVLEVGAMTDEIKTEVKKGDTILFKKWGINDVKIDGVTYQLLKFEDVLGIVVK